MKLAAILRSACLLVLVSTTAPGQTRSGAEFQVTKISKNLITPPQFTYTRVGCGNWAGVIESGAVSV